MLVQSFFQIKVKFISIITFGSIICLGYYLIGAGNVRLILPFLLIAALVEDRNSYKSPISINLIFYIWFIIILGFGLLTQFGVLTDSHPIYLAYKSEESDGFIYDVQNISEFRHGSLYFNPNQPAFLAIIFFGFILENKILTKIIFIIFLIILGFTQSRLLLIVLSLGMLSVLWKKKNISLFITVLVSLLLIPLLSKMEEGLRIFHLSSNFIEHGFYKFTLLNMLFERNIFELLIGSGYSNVPHFDSDLGYIIYIYGLVMGVAIVLTYILLIYIRFNFIVATLFLLASTYGTVLLNTRIAIVFLICYIIFKKNQLIK